MTNIVPIRGREAPSNQSSKMDTMLFTVSEVNLWQAPPFQRPLRINKKVTELANALTTNGGFIPGVLTLGTLGKDKQPVYIVDGQHRKEAFKLSGLLECIADVRMVRFDTMAEMAKEFDELNSALVRMRPDDVLRGLEGGFCPLQIIREGCPFVGYDQIRRAKKVSGPMLGMSLALRSWIGSASSAPTGGGTASAVILAQSIDELSAGSLVRFLNIAHAAWGRDRENFRLWSALNLTIVMWLWRQVVLQEDWGLKRSTRLNQEQFKQCLMTLSASKDYSDWLMGRLLSERDRGPCYARIKQAFSSRLREAIPGKKVMLPQPPWAS